MNVSTLGQNKFLMSRVADLQSQILDFQSRVSTGKKTDRYSGLSIQSKPHLDLTVERQAIEGYQKTIEATDLRMESMQTSLTRMTDICRDVRNEAIRTTDKGNAVGNDVLKTKAIEAIYEVTRLLNVNTGGRYLFAGRDTATQPMRDAGYVGTPGTPLDDIENIVNTGPVPPPISGAGTAAPVFAAIQSYFAVTSNSYLADSTGAPISARIDHGVDMIYGIRGDDQAFKDLLTGLYAAAGITISATNEDGADQLAQLAADQIGTAIDKVQALAAKLGTQQKILDDKKVALGKYDDFLERQLGTIENADYAESITQLTMLQTQLQASFQITAQMRQLTLTNFLS